MIPQRLKDRLQRSWPTASLRTYLFAIMLLATLPMAALMTLQGLATLRGQQAKVEDELQRSTAALAQLVEGQLASSLDGLGVLAQSELFQHGRIAALGRLLQGHPRGDWDSVFLLDRDGSLVLDTASHRPDGPGLAVLRALQRQIVGGQPAISGLWDGQRPGSRAIAVAVPIVQNGQIRSVLGARMGEAVWQRLAASVAMPAGGAASVVDAQGRLLGTSAAAVAPADAALPEEAAQDMREQPAGMHRTSDSAGRTVYAAWRTLPASGWRVQVAVPAAPIDAIHRRAIAAALATSGASLLLGLLLAGLVARQVSRPLRRLAMRQAQDLPAHVPVREIALLRDALLPARAQDGEPPGPGR